MAHATQSGLQTRSCCAEKSRRLAELVTQTFRFTLGNLSTLGLKGEAVLARRKEILKIAVGVTADYSLDRAFALHANAQVAAKLTREHKEMQAAQTDDGTLKRERKVVMGNGVIERLRLDAVKNDLAIELDPGNRLGKTGRNTLNLGNAASLAKIAVATVASSTDDHGRIVTKTLSELFASKTGEFARELRAVGSDTGRMHRPVHKARKWLAFGIEERYDNDLIVGEFTWDDAVVVETGDDFLPMRQVAGRALARHSSKH